MTDAELRALVAKATPGPLVQSGRAILLPSGDMLAMLNLAMDVDECHANVALIVAAVNALPALLDRLAAAERDAERYRWLREYATHKRPADREGPGFDLLRFPWNYQLGAREITLDAAIDAAREGK